MTRFRLIAAAAFFAALLPSAATASGPLIKGPASAVYYVDEGKRYVFPNEKVYFSWYQGFDGVETVSAETLASYPIGGNVTYRPGLKLVKIQTDPRVYAVGSGGRLRWIATEQAASALYGTDWNHKVDDIPDAFFFTYKEGEPVASAADFDKASELMLPTIADDISLRAGGVVSKEFSARKSGAWSDATVWGGSRPGTGAQVKIPAGIKVIYDMESSPSLKTLEIFGTLEFYTETSTKLAARQITVRGSLTAGTPDAPVARGKSAEIFLTGAASTAVGDDGLTVDGGVLSLHGASVGQAWSNLAAPTKSGAAKITLSDAVAWPVGSEVAVLGATHADAHEIRVIKAVEGAIMTLDSPLEDAHRSEQGLRTEVVLLDRNVAVSGTGDGFGSYVRGINRAKIDVSNVEFAKLGRKGAFGQYPLLFDGLTAPILRESVIRASGNRCATLRQTTGAKIEGNAAFGVYGHCFATEDGAETDNAFSGNLVADVRAGALPGDEVPSGFLIKHPGNALRGNAVVASSGFGYWYFLPENAVKNSGTRLKPREAMLLSFDGNSVRGARKTGLYVDDNDKGMMNYIPDDTAVFTGLTAVMNGERGFWIRGAGMEVRGAYLSENGIGGTFAAFGASLKDSVIEGKLAGSDDPKDARRGFTYHDGPVSLMDVTFRRFEGDSSALGFERENPRLPDPRNSLRRVMFIDAVPWRAPEPVTSGDAMSVVRDIDAGETVAARSPFLGTCDDDPEAGVMRCADLYAQLVLALRDSPGDKNVTFTNLVTGGSVTLKPGSAFDGEYAYANVAEGGAYKASIPNVPSVRVEYDGFTKPLQVRLSAGLGASVRSSGTTVAKVGLPELAPGAWAYDAAKSEAVLWLNPGDVFDLIR
ncbi:MAG: G8 domain-containing protein [Patescibacteria group bacterium]